MNVFVSGSLAYDRIMDFPGSFADHILPEKTHVLNVSFTVNSMQEKFGGTAGNIAYALSLLGEKPIILAAIGQDYPTYFEWLTNNQIACDNIKVIKEEFTACAYITTDRSDNQITEFNPGAMKYPSSFDFDTVDANGSIVIVSPGNLQDMKDYPLTCKARGIDYIFDPGQSLPMWKAEDLMQSIEGSTILVTNDYELEMIVRTTGLDKKELLKRTGTIVNTLGKLGSRVYTSECDIEIPAAKSKMVVDPTGAGDAYRAGLIKGLIQGKDIATCAKMGSVCASFAIEHYGTQEYSFSPGQFEDRLKKLVSQS